MPSHNIKTSTSFYQRIILYLFPLLSYCGFRYKGIDTETTKMIFFVFVPLMILYIGATWLRKNQSSIFNLMRFFIILFLISSISAWITWGQSIVHSFRALALFWSFLFYFFLVKVGFELKELERFAWINLIIYIALWSYALYMAPERVFGYTDEEYNLSRGFFRIDLVNQGVVPFALLLSLTKWKEGKKSLYLFILIMCFVLLILQVVRQSIMIMFIIFIWYFIRKQRFWWLWILIAIITFQSVSINLDSEGVISKLLDLTNNELEASYKGDENIRITAFKYFISDFPQNVVTLFFGNGVPHSDSAFGKLNLHLNEVQKFYLSDVGYAALFVHFGLFGVATIFLLIRKVLATAVPEGLLYSKLFVIFIFLFHIASYALFTHSIFFCLAIYLLDIHSTQKK